MALFMNTVIRGVRSRHYPTGCCVLFQVSPISQLRFSSKKSDTARRFSQSMILLQDGLTIQELPIIVKRTNDVATIYQNIAVTPAETYEGTDVPTSPFKNCRNLDDIFITLSDLETKDVTPSVAVHAFRRLSELGQFFEYRNGGNVQQSFTIESQKKSFTLEAVFTMLVQLVCKSSHSFQVLDSLKVFVLPSFPVDTSQYRTVLAEECLQRICDGKFSVLEVCDVIKTFSTLSKLEAHKSQAQGWTDQSWVGLVQRQPDDINESNILDCFRVLPLLNGSRRTVFNTLERRFLCCIYKLPVDSVISILDVIRQLDLPSRCIGSQVSRWLSVVLHMASEESFARLVSNFRQLNYCDSIFCKTLERYVRAKAGHSMNENLVSEVADYCAELRFRSSVICDVLADQFTKSANSLSPRTVESVIKALGFLHFQPSNEFDFWTAAEEVLEAKFLSFRPSSVVDILLSCIYLQRFPVNFIPRIFCTYFLSRLQSVQNEDQLRLYRTKLRLLDVAMTLECSQYANRMLPKDYSAKSISRDGRIIRMANLLASPLERIVGPTMLVSPSVVLADLPLHEYYVADILISPASEPVYYRYGLNRQGRDALVILFHPAEHFTREKTSFVGPQATRCRQLKAMGFRVLNLDLDLLLKYKDNEQALEKLLEHKLRQFA